MILVICYGGKDGVVIGRLQLEVPVNEERPGVWLDWSLWCARHLEPYRAQWPKGAPLAMLRLFDAAVRMDAVVDAAHGDVSQLTEALKRFAPLCCFIPRDQLQAIYDETAPRA